MDITSFVGKYYKLNRDTETLLFDGTYLKDGMVVVSGDINDRDDLKDEVRSEAELYERNMYSRWCTISHVRIEKFHYRNIQQVSFIATYEDGNQIKQTFPVPKSWIVKNDSIPSKINSSAYEAKIEETISGWIKSAMTEVIDNSDSALDGEFQVIAAMTSGRVMNLIGEIISEARFDRAYSTPETIKAYSKKDAEATMAMFDRLHSPLSKDDFIRICWADILAVVTRSVEKIEKLAEAGEVDPTANSSTIADEIIDAIYSLTEIYQKPVRSLPIEPSDEALAVLRNRLVKKPEAIGLDELARRSGRMIRPEGKQLNDFDGDPGSFPTAKFDKNLIRQQLAYNGPGSNAWAEKNPRLPEVNSFSENPPMISTAFARKDLDKIPELEESLIKQYLELFPAPEGMHNCLEVGCKVEIFDLPQKDAIESIRLPAGSPVYKIKHVLPLMEEQPPRRTYGLSIPAPMEKVIISDAEGKCENCGSSTHRRENEIERRCDRCRRIVRDCPCTHPEVA